MDMLRLTIKSQLRCTPMCSHVGHNHLQESESAPLGQSAKRKLWTAISGPGNAAHGLVVLPGTRKTMQYEVGSTNKIMFKHAFFR